MKKIFQVLTIVVLLTVIGFGALWITDDCRSPETATYLVHKGGLAVKFDKLYRKFPNEPTIAAMKQDYEDMISTIEEIRTLKPSPIYATFQKYFLSSEESIANATSAILQGDSSTGKLEMGKATSFYHKALDELERVDASCNPITSAVITPVATATQVFVTETPLQTETPSTMPTLNPANCPTKDETKKYVSTVIPILNDFVNLYASLGKDVSEGNYANLEEYKKLLDEDIKAANAIEAPEGFKRHHSLSIQEMYLTRNAITNLENGDKSLANAKWARAKFLDNNRRLEALNVSNSCGV